MSSDNTKMHTILKNRFGHKTFRPGQADIISSILAGHDTLAVLPTGGGKSLCYQLPALMFKGLTIVVSPLIALMQDQVDSLNKSGIEALLLNSALDWDTYCENMDLVRNGDVKLLFCAPETLSTGRMQSLLSDVCVSCLAIDEAHCISEWGHDFRPDYNTLLEIRNLFPKAVCLALTATATAQVRKDIRLSLGFKDRKEFVGSFNRDNIFLDVTPKWRKKEGGAELQVANFLDEHVNESGIIYCFSRKQVDELTASLKKRRFSVVPYHAGLTSEKREKNQQKFLRGSVDIIIATVAFGMGIHKSDVRFVIHYDLPKSLEQYYQEIGRAGRDGKPSHALLLYTYADTRKIKFFIEEKTGAEYDSALEQLRAMVNYCESSGCRRKLLLEHFGEVYKLEEAQTDTSKESKMTGCRSCDICISGKSVDVDVTIPVQKLLSCVIRTEERYGASYVIDVLLGSRQKRILDNHHNTLSTWGIGKDYAKNDWFQLVHLLLDAGFLRKSSDYNVLSLTQDARDTLTERALVMLPFVPSGKSGGLT
ncbi:MAG TPA: RecQ family ATP-dependent DNA helicase [Treponemataceae bacterium]|nr:RecQ family ATP-dependent DNA helicase [Treponemataceae bacterium]